MENEERKIEDGKPSTMPQLSTPTKPVDAVERKKDLLKEIDLIQTVINRMASASFLIKGWAITMIAFIFSYKTNTDTVVLVIIPLLLFWFLDAFFLRTEKLYRKLYQWVIQNRMQTDAYLFSLDTTRFKDESDSLLRVMFSFTLGSFYGIALFLIAVYSMLFYFT